MHYAKERAENEGTVFLILAYVILLGLAAIGLAGIIGRWFYPEGYMLTFLVQETARLLP